MSKKTQRRPSAPLHLEALESRDCPAPFAVVGATGSPTNILSVKVVDDQGNLAASVQPFNNLTSIRVATGDFDGDGITDEVAVLGRRTNTDLRAEIVTYDMDTATGALTEVSRFDAFDVGILGNGFITTGDFDGDGDDDIAVAQIGGGRTTVTLQTHISQGDGAFQAGSSDQVDFGTISAPRIGAGDTDNDGNDEIVIAARTSAGADVRVFDADNATLTPSQQGQFTWTFGIDGYSRGAFVAVGEFDPTFNGEEIVLGSNVGGGGRVDVVNFDGATATLVTNGRFQPFEAQTPGYNAAVRVSVGTVANLGDGIAHNGILAGQDRFQNGQAIFAVLDFNETAELQDPNPPFELGTPFTVLTGGDGQAPGGGVLGPFVSLANTTLVQRYGGLSARNVNNLNNVVGDGDNVIADGEFAAFFIDGSTVALPSGATFSDAGNRLFANLNLLGTSAGDLLNISSTIRFYTDAMASAQQSTIIGVGEIDVDADAANFQLADDLPVPLSLGLPSGPLGTLLFGHFDAQMDLDNFFTGMVAGVEMGSGFWVITVNNTSGNDVTLVDWELIWDFA